MAEYKGHFFVILNVTRIHFLMGVSMSVDAQPCNRRENWSAKVILTGRNSPLEEVMGDPAVLNVWVPVIKAIREQWYLDSVDTQRAAALAGRYCQCYTGFGSAILPPWAWSASPCLIQWWQDRTSKFHSFFHVLPRTSLLSEQELQQMAQQPIQDLMGLFLTARLVPARAVPILGSDWVDQRELTITRTWDDSPKGNWSSRGLPTLCVNIIEKLIWRQRLAMGPGFSFDQYCSQIRSQWCGCMIFPS